MLMIQKSLKYLWFGCLGALVGAFIFEGFLRLVEFTPAWKSLPVAQVSLYGPDEITGYTHRSNIHGVWTTENRAHVSTNAYGIRANGLADETIGQGDDWYRVGVIGNSIVEALQVENTQTFVARAEKNMQEQGRKVRIYNLGLSGSPPAVEALRAKKFAKTLNLHHIIFIDTPGNITMRLDYSQGNTLPFYKVDKKGDVAINNSFLNSRAYRVRQSIVGDVFYFLMRHFKIMNVLNSRLNRGLFAELENPLKAQNKNDARAATTFCDIESLQMLSDMKDEKHLKLLNVFLNDLDKIQRKEGVKITFALYDTWGDCDEVLHARAYKNIAQELNQKNIDFLNLKIEVQKGLAEYNKNNISELRGFGAEQGFGHLNHMGHAVFSRAITYYIAQ
jgi:desulfoferrodoxin (superoxide reductase-like protein)